MLHVTRGKSVMCERRLHRSSLSRALILLLAVYLFASCAPPPPTQSQMDHYFVDHQRLCDSHPSFWTRVNNACRSGPSLPAECENEGTDDLKTCVNWARQNGRLAYRRGQATIEQQRVCDANAASSHPSWWTNANFVCVARPALSAECENEGTDDLKACRDWTRQFGWQFAR